MCSSDLHVARACNGVGQRNNLFKISTFLKRKSDIRLSKFLCIFQISFLFVNFIFDYINTPKWDALMPSSLVKNALAGSKYQNQSNAAAPAQQAQPQPTYAAPEPQPVQQPMPQYAQPAPNFGAPQTPSTTDEQSNAEATPSVEAGEPITTTELTTTELTTTEVVTTTDETTAITAPATVTATATITAEITMPITATIDATPVMTSTEPITTTD